MNVLLAKLALLYFLLVTMPGPSPAAAADSASPGAAAEIEIATSPVEVDGEVLFEVRGAWTYPAEMRARLIRERIETIAADRENAPAALRVVASAPYAAIMSGNRVIMGVSNEDALLTGLSRDDLAAAHAAKISAAIDSYRQARRGEVLAGGLVKTAVAALLLCVLLIALRKVWERIDAWIAGHTENLSRSLEQRSMAEMRADRIGGFLRLCWRLLGWILVLATLIVFAGYLLEQFPLTRTLGKSFLALLLEPLHTMGRAFIDEIPALLFLAVLLAVIRLALRGLRLLSDAVAQGTVVFSGFEAEWARPSYNLARLVIIFFALVVAYPYIPGSESAAFKGISIFFGVMLSLGSSSAISNMIAGYMILYRRAFKIGDRVRIGEALGDVIDMQIQVTRLKSLKNEEIIIPNSRILDSEVVNYSSLAASQGLILHTTVGIGYEVPWRQVEAMLLEAAGRTPGLLASPAPFVQQKSLGDFAVNYELNAGCQSAGEMMALYSELHRNIQDVFNEYGVQIMTPAYEGDPETPKIVPRSEWFAPPAGPPAQG